ncbi:MAG: ComEA family DNA-binding protein [Lachnospiraceae bacterium]|nr:ComEA family DNA-binding protein [Lachnospiraceae bacterium]
MKKQIILLGIVVLMMLVGCTGCKKQSYLETQSDLQEEHTKSADTTEEKKQQTEQVTEIYVQIDGAVKKPGVYTFSEESRVYELIEAAGGLLPEAYDLGINQAKRLADGEKIYVYTKEEIENGAGTTDTQNPRGQTDDGKININTASVEELMTLSGIGETRAKDIIAYRNAHGAFSLPEDLKNVSGIGDSTYNKIADAIIVN